MEVKKNQVISFESSKQFEQLFKIGVLKQLVGNGTITEKQFRYILENQNKKMS